MQRCAIKVISVSRCESLEIRLSSHCGAGLDKKIPPDPRTNQIEGFVVFRHLTT